MPTFEADRTPVYLFVVDGVYHFKHFFEAEAVFEALKGYYNHEEYRFEVPVDEFEAVEAVLEAHHYEPVPVEDLEAFCVVIDRYEPHADVLRNAVLTWDRRGHRFFAMKDPAAVELALERGAGRVDESGFVVGL